MNRANFIEGKLISLEELIKHKNVLDKKIISYLLKKEILKKIEKNYYFKYVGMIFTNKGIIQVLPKIIEDDFLYKNDEELYKNMIRLFDEYTKRENLLSKEKEFLGLDLKGNGSFLSLIQYIVDDYKENGLYVKKVKCFEQDGSGRVDWNRTINKNNVHFNGKKPIYTNLVTIKKSIDKDLIITKIHKKIINKCNNLLKDMFLDFISDNDYENFELDDIELDDIEFLIENLEKELDLQYEDKKIDLLSAMIVFLKKNQNTDDELGLTFFGTRHFDLVWQKINSFIFNNKYRELSSKIPKVVLKDNLGDVVQSEKLIKEYIIYLEENNFYILDSKYYSLDINSGKLLGISPNSEDILKQLMFKQLMKKNKKYQNCNFINGLIIPTIKENSGKFGEIAFSLYDIDEKIDLVHMDINYAIKNYINSKTLDTI